MFKSFLKSKKVRYLAVGGVNTLWGLAAYPLLYLLLTPLGFNYIVILVLAYIVGTAFSFTTQKYLVFKTRGNHIHEILKFLGLQGIILCINLLLLPLLVATTGLNPVVLQVTLGIFFAVASYIFHDRITFNSQKSENDLQERPGSAHGDRTEY